MTNTKTIARNTGWYGLENAVSVLVSLFTSIAIARTLGPTENGYIIYVSYIAGLASNLGALGIPGTTRKYMAEFLGMGDRGTARYIYIRTLLLQVGLATLVTGGLLVWVLAMAHPEYAQHPEYRLASALLVLSIWPSMANSISAQANNATEDMAKNMPASVVSGLTYLAAIAATVVLKGGVIGVGLALLLMRLVDCAVRFFPAFRSVMSWETTHVHPPGLHRRMLDFAAQSVVSLLIASIVWSRSEVILLKHLCADIRQVSFYSIAFTMSDQLLLGATIFGTAAGTTIFAQYGRDKSRLPDITASTFRYLAILSIPLHFIFAALSVSVLHIVYGKAYAGAAAVVMLAPLLCLSKAFLAPASNLLQSAEQLRYVISATVIAGIVDVGVAWWLIPAHGSVGACIGNGAAQTTAVVLMWIAAVRLHKVQLPWALVAKLVFASAAAACSVYFATRLLAPVLALLCGGCTALVVLFALFYLLRIIEPQDHDRLKVIVGMLPRPLAAPADRLLRLLIHSEVRRLAATDL